MKTLLMSLAFALVALLSHGQTKAEKERLANELPKLDRAGGQFNPAFFSDTKNQHQVLVITVDNGVYTTTRRAVRPGKLPFAQEQNGPFVVTYLGSTNKRLGGYSIDTPASVRSCESQRVGPRSPTGKFSFEILLPNDPSILGVELVDQGKRITALTLPRLTPPQKP